MSNFLPAYFDFDIFLRWETCSTSLESLDTSPFNNVGSSSIFNVCCAFSNYPQIPTYWGLQSTLDIVIWLRIKSMNSQESSISDSN